MSNETSWKTWSWGNTTEEYCLTGKVPMAEDSYLCDWPNAPPFCEETWQEYVGESTYSVSKIVFICLFTPYFIIHVRMQYWSHLRQKIKKKGYWDKTSNEWLSFYLMILLFCRILQEVDYGAVGGIWAPQWMYVVTCTISGLLICCLYSIAWGWHKVLLPSVNKAEAVAKADKFHTALRSFSLLSNLVFGVLGAFILPEKYENSGVFNGNFHAINRIIMLTLAIGLLKFIVDMGNGIKAALESGGASNKVAPTPDGEKPAKKEKTDADKIGSMVKAVKKVMVVVILYLLYDIYSSVGQYRHVEPPFCGPKDVFVRLPSFVQLFATAAVTYVFPVKKPESKTGKTGMMGTTVTSSTG